MLIGACHGFNFILCVDQATTHSIPFLMYINRALHHPAADEPTSGLDSTTAMHLLTTLRQLASGGRAVVTTIHQPSSRLYMQLDKLLLLSEGHVMYYGESLDSTNATWWCQYLLYACKFQMTQDKGYVFLWYCQHKSYLVCMPCQEILGHCCFRLRYTFNTLISKWYPQLIWRFIHCSSISLHYVGYSIVWQGSTDLKCCVSSSFQPQERGRGVSLAQTSQSCLLTWFAYHRSDCFGGCVGKADMAADWFEKLGYPLTRGVNQADFFLDLASGDVSTKKIKGEDARQHCIACSEKFLLHNSDGFNAGTSLSENQLGSELWSAAEVIFASFICSYLYREVLCRAASLCHYTV